MTSTATENMSRWPFRSALAVALVMYPLIWVGGLVTTTKAGMAVPDWPGTYGYNLLLYPWTTWLFGPWWDLCVEHGHRLLGALVGVLSIICVFAVRRCDGRPWVLALSFVQLLAIIGQGVLGGMRVLMSDRQLAMTHGTTGPICFAIAVVLVAATSRRWRVARIGDGPRSSGRVALLSAILLGLVITQIGAGAHVRHISVSASTGSFTRFTMIHITIALLITALVALLVVWCWRERSSVRWLATMAGNVVVVQIALGVATWAARYAVPHSLTGYVDAPATPIVANGMWQTCIVTAHQATGTLLLGLLVLATAFAYRTRQATREQTMRLVPSVRQGAVA